MQDAGLLSQKAPLATAVQVMTCTEKHSHLIHEVSERNAVKMVTKSSGWYLITRLITLHVSEPLPNPSDVMGSFRALLDDAFSD